MYGRSISIHSPRMGRDPDGHRRPAAGRECISIHSPRMGRDAGGAPVRQRRAHFNPLSPHGERRNGTGKPKGILAISIHSPRMGRDTHRRNGRGCTYRTISIHSPRMGRDFSSMYTANPIIQFQSTLPAWGETNRFTVMRSNRQYFNPLSPHGERHYKTGVNIMATDFNPLSPHGERPSPFANAIAFCKFQSTLPAWGETKMQQNLSAGQKISIHSPRMGRDSKRTQLFEEKNWRICTTLYLFASKEVLPADKKTF